MNDEEPIKVVTYKSPSPLGEDIYHFEDGYKCLGTGKTALTVEELSKTRCNKKI